jgi:ubiquinone/menaquinone biosynthesis C-methylase UbiE
MDQDGIFSNGEGNAWFQRNKTTIENGGHIDWPCHLIELYEDKSSIHSVVELGSCNGYRLNKIRKILPPGCRCVGIDASREAVQDGRKKYPELALYEGVLSDIPLKDDFDLVIVNFVLHWVDRRTLVKSIAEIDRLTKDGGLLLIGDFLPDYQQRRRYHHLPNDMVFTYKQDYAKIFEIFGTYREIVRFTYNHDDKNAGYAIKPSPATARGYCSVLSKSLEKFYPEG